MELKGYKPVIILGVVILIVISGIWLTKNQLQRTERIVDKGELSHTPTPTPEYVEDYGTGECVYPEGRSLRPYSRCQEIKKYTSTNLGVEFNIHKSARITEVGNRIYVNGVYSFESSLEDSEYVEIFSKPANQTLVAKVKELMGSAPSCLILPNYGKTRFAVPEYESTLNFPNSYSSVTVKRSATDGIESEPFKCQNEYISELSNLFITDSDNPTKIAFFNFKDGNIPSGETLWWWQTFRFNK